MTARAVLRAWYLHRALLWGVLAGVTAFPAFMYLRRYAAWVEEGLSYVYIK